MYYAGDEYTDDFNTSGPYVEDAAYTDTDSADIPEDWASDEEHDAWLVSIGYTAPRR